MLHSRTARVNELIKQELAGIIDNELNNPLIPEFTTIHTVKVSKDLRTAFVTVTFLQDDDPKAVETAVKELNRSAGYLRQLLGQRTVLRHLPSLKFDYNPSTRYAAHMQEVFEKIEPPRTVHAEEEAEG